MESKAVPGRGTSRNYDEKKSSISARKKFISDRNKMLDPHICFFFPFTILIIRISKKTALDIYIFFFTSTKMFNCKVFFIVKCKIKKLNNFFPF